MGNMIDYWKIWMQDFVSIEERRIPGWNDLVRIIVVSIPPQDGHARFSTSFTNDLIISIIFNLLGFMWKASVS